MSTPTARVMRITVSGNRATLNNRKAQPTMTNLTSRLTRLIHVTDDQGRLLLDEDTSYEPLPGSIVMTEGVYGTAWQRWHGDNLWHRCGSSQKKDWFYLLTKRNLVLVYDAPEREETGRQAS